MPGGMIGLDNLVVLGPADVWAVAWGPTGSGPAGSTTVVHWDGASWRAYTVPVATTYYMGLAGTSDSNLWLIGSSATWSQQGHLVGYKWAGSAWQVTPLPATPVLGWPWITASASGRVWIMTGNPATAPGAGPVVYYLSKGKWHRLSIDPYAPVHLYPMPDGLTGIWFGDSFYWPGSGSTWYLGGISNTDCQSFFNPESGSPDMSAVPGSHSMLWAAACGGPGTGVAQHSEILISKQR